MNTPLHLRHAPRSGLLTLLLVVPMMAASFLMGGAAIAGDPTGPSVEARPEMVPDQIAQHIAYAERFRSQFDFLSTDRSYIEGLMLDGGHPQGFASYGLELAAWEYEELQRRRAVMARAIDVMKMVTGRAFDEDEEALEQYGRLPTGPVFGGTWQDHMDGGKLKLAVTDAAAVDRDALYGLFPRGFGDLAIIEQPYSLDDLYAWRDRIWSRILEYSLPAAVGFDYSDTGVRVRLELYPGAGLADAERILADTPRSQVVVAERSQGPVELGDPFYNHYANQMAGLWIGVWGQGWEIDCTWGLSGHTSSYHYLVTAGHCVTGAGTNLSGYGLRSVTQNYYGAQVISAANAFVYGRNDDSAAELDHARIQLHTSYGNSNCYHSDIGHCEGKRTTERLSLYGHRVGVIVCASLGRSNDFRCGLVTNVDMSGQSQFRGEPYVNRVQADICATWGDSGAGIISDDPYYVTIHGLLTDGVPCDEGDEGILFEPAYYVKAYMGATSFDFNCVWSGSWWGSCPVVQQ